MKNQNVMELFERSVDEHESLTAIERNGQTLTYGELDIASSNFANYLLDSGATKGATVAILLEDNVATIKAILGTLKAGCVFVPLEAGTPEKRLHSMFSLVEPQWFVVEEKFLELAERVNDGAAKVICIDGKDFSDYFNPRRPNIELAPDDMCYIYFTSGSTGQPKGIAGRMKGIDHFIRWEVKTLGIGPGTRVSQVLPFSFDGSLRDIFVPLTAGGTICVPPGKDTLLDAREFVHWIDSQRINIIHCVPSLFRAMGNQDLNSELCRDLKYILMAGEPLLPADVKRWFDVFGDRIQLINLYGTSETTMAKFIYFVKQPDQERRSIPIGQPMEGAAALIVDAKGRPCPHGAVGEIYIRTPFRSLGYYNAPELTREVFIPNPFNNDPNDIVYKTGDLARVLEDGNFEYLGRQDGQVKIRGIRVELEEIENVLRAHESVLDVAAIDREDAAGYNYLCAFVVLADDTNAAQLREHCAAQLPDFMLPSAFVVMSELPRTISGKIDRRALPTSIGVNRGEYVAPGTPVEELICNVFADVLGLKRVGAQDNFFHIGGHSLSATRVVSRVKAGLGAMVGLRDLFEAPTPALLAQRAEQIESGTVAAEPALLPLVREEGDALPLSFAQQRVWFFDQFEPNSSAYNMSLAVRLEGKLDVAALERAFVAMARRHEVLRTTFSAGDDGLPVQFVHPAPSHWPLPVTDLNHLPLPERDPEIRRIIAADIAQPFDLEHVPLMRTSLLHLDETDHVLVLLIHHIISDGWSMGVLVRETAALYEAETEGRELALPELTVQYADFAAWQREWLQGEVLDQQLNYWLTHLEGSPPALELPTDHPRPAVVSYRAGMTEFLVSSEVTERLRQFSEAEGATLFMTLVAAFNTLLYRYTGQDDIVIGTPIAGRNRAEIEPLIGFFVNSLVLRTDLSGTPGFRELVARVKEAMLHAYAHQDLPFEKLVEELQPERTLSHHPLFQVMFTMQNVPYEVVELPQLTLTILDTENIPAKFDFNVHMTEFEQGIVCRTFYNSDLFENATIERFCAHFSKLLESVALTPDERLPLLPMIGAEERQQLLVDWNDTRDDYQLNQCIHELFEEQVVRAPHAPALVFENHQLTYDQLNRRANQLAHYLRGLGVDVETRVGLHLERSLDLVIALLGILKAGAAYIALDPYYPLERKVYILDDAAVTVLITHEDLSDRLPTHPAQVVDLEAEQDEIAAESDLNPERVSDSDGLAYVIYTSGASGWPKGVGGSHRQLLSYIHGISERLGFTPGASFAMQQTPSVDAPITFLFGALCGGGVLHVISRERSADARALGEYFRRHHIDYFKVAPSYLVTLQSYPQPEQVLPRRLLLVSGEASRADWIAEVQDLAPDCRIVNHYGPTETTAGVLTYEVTPEVTTLGTSILPLGRPLPNAEIYLLDEYFNPAPKGVPGELYIGGPGLARGYLNRPDLTAEKFIPHPFSQQPGRRLYRTGDLGRYRHDGNIEFLGRRDHQVNIGGFQVELEEIEAVLSEHEAVLAAVVLFDNEDGGEGRLTAYVERAPGHIVASEELRDFLRTRLPDHMIPTGCVVRDELPRTAQGKLDRQGLSTFAPLFDNGEGYVAPRTPVEKKVAELWSQLLGVDRVSANHSFFDLGGHSLLIMQFITRVRQTWQVELPVRALFKSPTVTGVAETIAQLRSNNENVHMPAIMPIARESRRARRDELTENVR
ncbi:MAG TPA: amino acid adenylation domain-containing protein [Pyrinomonadaceae bacterium]|nr:amino acid adenylation domain-containing protein [Pyrinomonadaceae bacterium]